MRKKKTIITLCILFLLLLGLGSFLWVRSNYYVAVLDDTANICGENSSTAAMPDYKTIYVRKNQVDTYIKEAKASGRCVNK